MNTFLRRIPAAVAFVAAVFSATVALATPTISFTPGQFPATGSPAAPVTTPSGLNISVTAAPTAGSTISNVSVSVNGSQIGIATGASPFVVNWIPTAPGTYTIAATVTDTSTVTTGAGASTNTATINSVVTLTTVRTATLATTAGVSSVAQGSQIFFRSTASMSDSIVGKVEFFVDGALVPIPTGADPARTALTQPPFNAAVSLTVSNGFAVGSHTITAVATSSDGALSVTSPSLTLNVATPVSGNSAPVVSLTAPSNGASVAISSNITVSATASDSDGFVPSTAGAGVTFFVDGDPITPATGEANPDLIAPYSITWRPTVAKSYSLRAQTIDNSNNIVLSPEIVVTGSSAVPTVSLSAATTAVVGSNVTFTATTTAGSGGAISLVEFSVDGVVVGTDATPPSPFTFVWSAAGLGSHTLTARAVDASGGSVTSSSRTITVSDIPATSATVTGPATATVGTATNLTASVSVTSPNTISSVQFFVNGIAQGAPDATSPYAVAWTPTTAGTAAITALVTDSTGASSTSAAFNVAVSAAPATGIAVALTSPVNGASVATNSPTTLTATASPTTGTTVLRVDFLLGAGANPTVIGSSLTAPYTFQWTPTAAGVAVLSARVTDTGGNALTSAPVAVTVGAAPALSVTLAMSGSTTIPAGSTRALTAVPTPATNVDRVELLYDGSIVASDNTTPYNFLFTAPDDPRAHTLRARVVDTSGNSAESANVNITIGGGGGVSPLVAINAPLSNAFVPAGVVTPIAGSASDADGSITSVQVFVNGVSLGNANLTGTSWTINWTPSGTAVASIVALATDNTGNAIASVPVGVNIADSASPAVTLSLSPRTAATAASTTLPSGAVRNFVADAIASSGRAVVRVEFFIDGTKVGEDTSGPYTFRYIAPALADGEQSHSYVLSARATDNAGAARDVQLPILVVSPLGLPPTVNLLTPPNGASVFPNNPVSLAATAVANGGTITSVQFYVNGSPAGINAGNGLPSAPYTVTFTPTAPGVYTVDAIATDDRGNTAISNSATFTAAFATPTVTFTSPNPNATARATPGVPLTLAATATVQSGAGAAILLVEFLLDDAQIGADTTAPFTFSWVPTTAQLGTHRLTVRVTDTNSQTSVSAPVSVNVANVIGSPPTVSVSASPIPGGFGLQTASTVNFVATAVATGAGSTLNSVEIFLNDISIGLATREQNTNFYRIAYDLGRFDFTAITPIVNDITGAVTYPVRLYAIARDSNNNQTVSATTNLIINPATSLPPTIQLLALTPLNITAGTQFFMAAVINDPDGTVTSVQLFANGTSVGTFGNPQQGAVLTYNANNAGTFNLYAVATDDTGNTTVSTPSIRVTVTAVNAPITNITRPTDNSTTATVGSPVFLEGTAVNTSTTQIPTMQFVATAGGGSRQIINGIRVGNTTTYRAIWTPINPDTYTVTTQASVGVVQGTSTSSRRVVATEVLGLAPTISLTRAPGQSGVPTTATTASTADFAATATDPDGSIVEVEFFLNRNSVGLASKDPQGNTWRVTAAFAGLQPGANEVVALAKDSSLNIVASPTSTINVVAASSIAPSIAITPSTLNPAFNRAVQLRANARDSDGTVTSVQYFANATSIGTSTNSGSLFLTNWTPTVSGSYYLWALATDNSGITRVSDRMEVNVRRNNPVLENAAFILQTYQDIANTTNINPLVFDELDEQLGNGTLTRADIIVSPLTANGGVALTELAGFQAPVNLLALYYVLMGQWPTSANYTTFIATARNSLPAAAQQILNANEYFAKYGFVPTQALLDNPNSAVTAEAFLNRLHESAGIRPPEPLDRVSFRSNNVLSATRGRGYAVVGLAQAISEFVTNTNSTNTALFAKARAAALFYQLARPPVTVPVEEITARIDALLRLPNQTAIADAVLKDVLYGYRYVTITKHPQSLLVAARSGALFSVEAQGAPPLVYQWLLNGAPIAGATNPTLSLTNVDASRVGTYTVAITSNAATATSDRATLTLSTAPTKLANISTRGVTNGGANVLIGGFVVAGANAQQTRQMLIRVVGPTLGNAPFNVPGTLANPRLEVYQGNNPNPVLTNDDWGTQAGGAAQVTAVQQAITRAAAFPFQGPNSADAAVFATLPPGAYTVQAKGPANNANASGVVLIEVYDVTPNGTTAAGKATNVSTRGSVGTGTNILIAGFVVNGTVARRVLIRGAGPTLASLGVPGVLADPQLTLIDQATGKTIATNDNWASGDDAAVIATAAQAAGAFPFASGSRDAAMIVMLPPGSYTAQLSGVNNGTGVGIVEVYDVDP